MSKPREVIAVHPDGMKVRYHSVAIAARVFNCKEDHIRRALRGERKTAYGLKWRFAQHG